MLGNIPAVAVTACTCMLVQCVPFGRVTGAIGFCSVDGVPRVGQLMEAAWSLNDTCRFKIRTSLKYALPASHTATRRHQCAGNVH